MLTLGALVSGCAHQPLPINPTSDGKSVEVEIHNPTSRAIEVRIDRSRKLVLDPGDSTRVRLELGRKSFDIYVVYRQMLKHKAVRFMISPRTHLICLPDITYMGGGY